MAAGAKKLPFWADAILLPALNLLAAFLVSGIVIWALGEDPFLALSLLIDGAFGFEEAISYTFYYATNFIFTGLAVSIAFHAGHFNIGGEGQAMLGGLGLTLAVFLFSGLSPFLAVIMAIIGAALFGAAWAYVPAYLQAKRGSHIVITTIMFNFIASSLLAYLLVGPLQRPGGQMPESADFPEGASLMPLHEIFGMFGKTFEDGPMNVSLIIALLCAVGVWFLLWRTRFGYELRVVGQNPNAAAFAGVSVSKMTIIAMMISGALAGMMGLNELLGQQHRLLGGFTLGYGFVGIAVAFMGRNHPVGIILAALLFGALYQGGAELAFEMPTITRDLIIMIQGLVILFAGALEHLFRDPVTKIFTKIQTTKEGAA
ncbi:ABC transporter permease [Kordiimonas laminariae]|uniref:ABC transporter permease n=1 Tax=Kordiimonas laminariae TaxID=2917717 RepID=UPI001FF54BF8|nr:ABC transporter permease [Kordiimonas laminariae]MCK0068880.1 ABC transporter permease [Kordiimonas laminariae]